jgi:5'(3')-deoxyribonucleotidase
MTENNKNPISAFAEEYIIREKQLIPGSFTKLVVEEEKVTNFATENLDNLNNLEVLYSQSNPIELPTSCYEFISNINDTIPYLRYQQVLREQGIIIITLNYDDDDGSILEKIVNLIGIPHTHDNNGKVV